MFVEDGLVSSIEGGFSQQGFTRQSVGLDSLLEQVGDAVTRLVSGQLMALNRVPTDMINDYNLSSSIGGVLPAYAINSPVWSANGRRVVFQCNFPGNSYEICVYDVTTDQFRNVTNSPGVYDHSPTISPDGNHIAYASDDPSFFIRSIYLYEYASQTVDYGIANADYPIWQGEFVYYRDALTNTRILRNRILLNTSSEILLTLSELEVYGGALGQMDAYNNNVIFSTEKWDCTVDPCERTNSLVQINATSNGTPYPTRNTIFLYQSQTFPQITDIVISPRGDKVLMADVSLPSGVGYCYYQLLTGIAGQTTLNSIGCGLPQGIDWSTNVNLSAPISTPTPTPSPTLTPSPITCSDINVVSFTSLDLCENGTHSALRSGMIFAVFNETSGDNQYFGEDQGLTNAPQDDFIRSLALFLHQNPYCENGQNLANDEPPSNPTGWDNSVIVEHCNDHRYMSANVILNGFLSYEQRSSSTDINIGYIYGYLSRNFGGTFGITAASNPLWDGITSCSSFLSPFPATLPNSSGQGEQAYNNLDQLFSHISVLLSGNGQINSYQRDINNIDTNAPNYQSELDRLNGLISGIQQSQLNYPGLYR